MIRRHKSDDGIFSHDKIESSGEDLESTLKDHLSKIGRVEPLLEYWAHEGETILQEQGYPLGLQGLSDALQQGEHARQIHDIRAMLFRLDQTRRAIAGNRIELAVWNMALAVQFGLKAQLRPLEPTVEMGKRTSNVSRSKRAKRQIWQGLTPEQRQARNEAIWAAYKKTKLSLNGFAIDQGKKHRLSPTSIKNIIKKYLEKSSTLG